MQSMSLQFDTQVDVVIPQCAPTGDPSKYYSADNKLPSILLMHGGGGDRADWLRFTRMELLADEFEVAFICPSAQNSSYMNMAYGPSWADWIYDELYDFTHSIFPLSTDPQKNFTVGMSMGGYGAFRGALKFPERYGWGAALSSGACVPQKIASGEAHNFPQGGKMMAGDFDKILGGENDLFAEAERLMASGRPIPKLLSSCGTEDFTYQENLKFRDHLLSLGYDLKWIEASGAHNWDYWESHLRDVLEWLPLKGK